MTLIIHNGHDTTHVAHTLQVLHYATFNSKDKHYV